MNAPWTTLPINLDYDASEVLAMQSVATELAKCEVCEGTGMLDGARCKCDIVRTTIREMITARIPRRYWPVTAASLLSGFRIYGPANSGKSFAAFQYIKHCLFTEGRRAIYLPAGDLTKNARDKMDENSPDIFKERMTHAEVLVFDDLDTFWATPWTVNHIDSLIRAQYDAGKDVFLISRQEVLPKPYEVLNDLIMRFNGSYFCVTDTPPIPGSRTWQELTAL